MALVLLVGAGLMAHTLRANSTARGPRRRHRQCADDEADPSVQKYKEAAITRFFVDLVDRLNATPGVAGGRLWPRSSRPSVFSSERDSDWWGVKAVTWGGPAERRRHNRQPERV